MSILQVIGASLNFLTLIALARLLTPEDFGVAAVASLATGLIGTFGDFGLGAAVIQRTTEVEEALYTANTLRVVISTTMFMISISIAGFAASLLTTPAATGPIQVASILFVLNGAMFIPQTRLSKEMKFGIILKAALIASLVSAIISVVLAYFGFGYWTIIIASLVAAGVNLGAFWVLSPWRITIRFNRRIARELIAYGKHLFLTTIFTFFVLNIDDAGVVVLFGGAALGLYAFAYKWANVPVNFLSRVVSQVMTPAYVLLRDAPERLRRGYLETVQLLMVVSLPIYLGLIVLAEGFVDFILGTTWAPIVTPLRVLCLMGILRGLSEPGAYLFMATGDSKLVSLSTGLHLLFLAALLVPGLLVGAMYGVVGALSGAAWAVAIAYMGNLVVVSHFVNRILHVSWRDLALLLRSLLPAGLAMIGTLVAIEVSFTPSLLLFLIEIGVGLVAYLVVLMAMEGNIISRYLSQILDARQGG